MSGALLPTLQDAMNRGAHEVHTLIVSQPTGALPAGAQEFEAALAAAEPMASAVATASDDPGFWLYSSGSTGKPKGTVHTHANLWWTAELYGKPVLGLTEARRLLLGREDVLCVRARQCADLSAVGRRHRRADGRAAHARRHLPPLGRAQADRVLRRAHRLCRHARLAEAAGSRSRWHCACALPPARPCPARSRSASRRTSAARSSTASAPPRCCTSFISNRPRRRALRHHRQAGGRLRGRAARRGRPPGARRRGGRSLHPRPQRGAHVLVQPREVARDLPGRLDQERRQVHARCRRLLHLCRPAATTC